MGVARTLLHMTHRDEIDIDLRDIDERILDKLEEMPSTRQHLASELDVTGEYVYQRVDLLIKLGVVERIHDGFYRLAESDAETKTQSVVDQTCASEDKDVDTAESDGDSVGDESMIVIPEGMPQKIDEEEARQAIAATVALLQENQAASQLEITKAVMPDWPLTYNVDNALARLENPEKRNRTTWWRNVILPALKAHPDIEKPDSSGQEWQWVGN